jgi:serine/threonine protein kinase
MAKTSFKIKIKKGIIEITDKDYKAAGGQAAVYCIGKTAYKIYHDPKRMIPEAKIMELSVLKNPNILGPQEVVYDPKTGVPLGFTMPYEKDTEFLCKIFTRDFRDDNNISSQDVVHLVTDMQKTLEYIHSMKILVVDYNEMNFLLNSDLKQVYSIDVDSWQTKSFSANALMESIRDRKGLKGKFTELTDWFSFAVVTFQMYTGIHPYKGYHPKYKHDWNKKMDLGISVFDKDVQLPPACQDFSVIPKKHLDWYKEIFVNNDRSIPPYADLVIVGVSAGTVSSKGKFVVELIYDYISPIKRHYFFDNKRYILTTAGIYQDDRNVFQFEKTVDKATYALCDVYGEDPIVARHSKGMAHLSNPLFMSGHITFCDFSKNIIETIPAEHAMSANGLIYSVNGGEFIEHSFERLGKLIPMTKVMSSLCPSYKVFSGVIVQDDFMKCHLIVPYAKGMCANIHVKELDNCRIIDAKHRGLVTVLIHEKGGDYFQTVLCFNKTFTAYTYWQKNVDLQPINFVALPNGLNILAWNDKVVGFSKVDDRKEVPNAPINALTPLFHEGMTVLSTEGSKLYKVRMS